MGDPGAWWALLAFRLIGLSPLAAAAIASMQGRITWTRWSALATLAAALLVVSAALSTVLSVHRGKSLEAMLNELSIVGLFLAAALVLRGARWLRWSLLAPVLAAVPVALLGIAQHFRPDLVPADSSYPGRALGPFGQPNRLGGYLIAAIPLALALAFAAPGRGVRIALVAAAFVLMLCLVLTYSRGAWLAFALSLAAFAAALLARPDLRPEPATLAAALALLALPVLVSLPSILARVAPRTQPASAAWNLPIDPEREGSGAMRRAVWSGAIAASAARPAIGWGPGAFREAFDRSKSDTMKRLEAEGARTADQAHSVYLKILAERGVLGLAAFLLFAGAALAGGLAALGSGAPVEARLLSAGLLASLIALLSHGLLEDNLALPAHGAWLAAGAGALTGANASRRPARRSFAVGAAALLVVALATVGSARSAAAGAASAEARAALGSGDLAAGLAAAERAARLSPWDDRAHVLAAKAAESAAAASANRVGGTRAALLRSAERSYREAIGANAADPVTRHELARLYLANADVFGDAGRDAASRELSFALDQNPHYAEIRNDLGVALLRAGDGEGAKRAFERASRGRREFVDPLLNLAALALQRGDRAEAARWIDEALERHPGSARAQAMRAEFDD